MEKESNRIAKVIARSGICSRRDAERKKENAKKQMSNEDLKALLLKKFGR